MADLQREDIRLLVDGVLYGGWKSVEVPSGIEQAASAWRLSVTEKWPGQPRRKVIRPGAACELMASGDRIIVGYVDDVDVDYDPDQHAITITGRDKIGDLVDCAAVVDEAHEFYNLTVLEFARRICKPYGIAVTAEVDVGAPFARFSIQPGETAFAAIERACRHRALLPNSDGQGGLVLTRAGQGGRGSGALQLGRNVKRAAGNFTYRDRFSLTVLRGQQEGSDLLQPAEIAAAEGRASDSAITRYRPTVIVSEQAGNDMSLSDRAAWEVRVARGRSRKINYTTAGWRDDAGKLWRPNSLVRVVDGYLDAEMDMLIVNVTRRLTIEGTITELQLALPDAYDLLPEPDEDPNPDTGYLEAP
ncbi:MAG: hypothetical protein E6Q98_24700 [Rhodospirillaceae bacterium]|nr:MAG: hypothetical protein E6Q98_24700 [Rhodospirillaceae bacterium]